MHTDLGKLKTSLITLEHNSDCLNCLLLFLKSFLVEVIVIPQSMIFLFSNQNGSINFDSQSERYETTS